MATKTNNDSNLLWSEIPEESAENVRGGKIAVLFSQSAEKKKRTDPGAGGPIDLDSAFGPTSPS